MYSVRPSDPPNSRLEGYLKVNAILNNTAPAGENTTTDQPPFLTTYRLPSNCSTYNYAQHVQKR
jgi:hypothetical protein